MIPEPRYLEALPYPVAYPYGLVFDEHERPSIRRWALCFTQYQALRMVCLPLMFPGFPRALKSLGKPEERPVALHGRTRLNPLGAILALRNATAHGGLVDEAEAARHLAQYIPVLHEVLRVLGFLADAELLVSQSGPEALATGRASLLKLRGARLEAPVEEDLTDALLDALEESRAVLRTPSGAVVPLYPMLAPVAEQEPLYLYDGHYGIRVETQQAVQERSYVYYLGTHHRAEDTAACERLKDLLARRQIGFFLSKAQTAPWSIADSAADYSRRTLEDLIGQKYFPACYVPFTDLERHFERFLRAPDPERWPATGRARYVNGLVLIGLAGAGKTAFLARQVERLTAQDAADAQREGRNLVLFLRGNGIALRQEGVSLFRDLAEKLGLAVTPAATRDRPNASASASFSSVAELFAHLHGLSQQDRVEGRRLVLVLDALNEAPLAEKVIAEALEIVDVAANYPWCKVVISTRQEWLSLWSSKLGAQESSRLEELRPWLYVIETDRDQRHSQLQGPPVVMLEPLAEAQAADVYGRYEAAVGASAAEGWHAIPASTTPWDDLPTATRALLANPLNLHLFMEAFDGHPAEALTAVPALYRHYVDRAIGEPPGLEGSIEVVVANLLEDLRRPSADLTDDDCNLLRRRSAESRSAEEARLGLSPVEAMAHEGFITKRVREEGGGYRFLFQAVAEYLIYCSINKARPSKVDELEYWTRRAQPTEVFPEYAGAFGFLLRDWAVADKLETVGPLAEHAAEWFGGVLVDFLDEQARTGHQAGTASASAEAAARALEATGGAAAAQGLFVAGFRLAATPCAGAATKYYEACIALLEIQREANPERIDIADDLALVLNKLGLGVLLRDAGRVAEAETAYRRAVQVYEALHAVNPETIEIAAGYAWSLTSVARFQEAASLAEWVLERAPQYPYATRVRDYSASVPGNAVASRSRVHKGNALGRGWARVKQFLGWGG